MHIPKILPLRQRADIRREWLKKRLTTILPEIMQREGFDMWLVIAREYNEDPVIMTLLPEPAMSARRRTILLFHRTENNFEALTVSRYGMAGFYESAWNPEEQPDQWQRLAEIVRERDPQRIGINIAPEFAFGDGLSHNEYEHLKAALGEALFSRCESAERLCIGWLERRLPEELAAYSGIVEMGHALIREAYSNRVIHPGITTTEDVEWWMRQRMLEMGVQAWFHPSVEIQAPDMSINRAPGLKEHEPLRKRIMPGDLLHCDVGFYYLGLATDHQQHAYVLKNGETDAPEGLKHALTAANRLQDIHMQQMQVGRTGNEVLKATLEQAKADGIKPQVYSHAIGYHGHAAGPTIGLWDQQGGVEGRGDYEIFDDTCYSIELNIRREVPEWGGQEVRIALEEDAVMTGGKMFWLDGRQTKFHLIG